MSNADPEQISKVRYNKPNIKTVLKIIAISVAINFLLYGVTLRHLGPQFKVYFRSSFSRPFYVSSSGAFDSLYTAGFPFESIAVGPGNGTGCPCGGEFRPYLAARMVGEQNLSNMNNFIFWAIPPTLYYVFKQKNNRKDKT